MENDENLGEFDSISDKYKARMTSNKISKNNFKRMYACTIFNKERWNEKLH